LKLTYLVLPLLDFFETLKLSLFLLDLLVYRRLRLLSFGGDAHQQQNSHD
jgi:hypothetical protein